MPVPVEAFLRGLPDDRSCAGAALAGVNYVTGPLSDMAGNLGLDSCFLFCLDFLKFYFISYYSPFKQGVCMYFLFMINFMRLYLSA